MLKKLTYNNKFLIAVFLHIISISIHILQTTLIKKSHLQQSQLDTSDILLIRSFVSLLLITPFLITKFKHITQFAFNNKLKIKIILFALFSSLSSYLWHLGVKTVPINNASIISFLNPFCVTFLSFFYLKERVQSYHYIILIVSFMLIFFTGNYAFSTISINIGYVYIMLDIFIYSFAAIMKKELLNKNIQPMFIILIILISLFLFGCILSRHSIFNLINVLFHTALIVKIEIIIVSLLHTIQIYSTIKSYQMTAITNLQFLKFFRLPCSFVISLLILNEKFTFNQVFSGLIMIAIVFFLNKNNQEEKYIKVQKI